MRNLIIKQKRHIPLIRLRKTQLIPRHSRKYYTYTAASPKSMQIAHFHILNNPSVMSRLRTELSNAGNPTSLKALEQLPYLSAIIHEAKRLSFGLTGRNTRVTTDDEVLQYNQYTIPPSTGISMTTLCIHTTEDIFPDPWTFDPDRFLGKEGMERRKYMMSMRLIRCLV
jgi:cytochrome P450